MIAASITLPTNDANGADLTPAHCELVDSLTALYGAPSVAMTSNRWRDLASGATYSDPALVYTVALPEWTDRDAQRFRNVAARICRLARQEAIAIVDHEGDAEHIRPPQGPASPKWLEIAA